MEQHDLLHEFPEYQDKIKQLRGTDKHFKQLFDDYNGVEHQVHLMKTDEVVATDEALKELKAKLLHIKDEIYTILKK
jgi:hypothetical protein